MLLKIFSAHYTCLLTNSRRKNPEKSNKTIFEILCKEAEEGLQGGENVVLEVASTTLESRSKIFKTINTQPYIVNAIILTTPLDVCMLRAKENGLGSAPLKEYKNFQIPLSSEGFDNIFIIPFYSKATAESRLNKIMIDMRNYDDDLIPRSNAHHEAMREKGYAESGYTDCLLST